MRVLFRSHRTYERDRLVGFGLSVLLADRRVTIASDDAENGFLSRITYLSTLEYRMKRVIAPLGLCLALAACGQSGDSAITPPEPAEPSSAVIPPGTRSSPAPTTTVVSGAGDTYGLPYGIELDFPHTLRVERDRKSTRLNSSN